MKSKFLFAALALITLAACSNDEVVSEQQKTTNKENAIAFRTFLDKSRASVETLESLKEDGFYAIALQSAATTNNNNNKDLWNGAKLFKYNETSGMFETTEDIEWESVEVKFYASNIEPGSDKDKGQHTFNVPGSNQSTGPSYVEFTPLKKIADQIDFVYASNRGTRSDFGSSGIGLNFRHALAQIEVQAKCDESSDYRVKVKGYKLVYVCDKGTFTFVEPNKASDNATNAQPVSTFDGSGANGSYTTDNASASAEYVSNIYKGYGYGDSNYTGIFDMTNNYKELNGGYQVINGTLADGTTSEGTAMIIPQNVKKMGYDTSTTESRGKGFYIALLVQVDKKVVSETDGTTSYEALYPAMALETIDGHQVSSATKRIAYRGLPKYYGYIAIPVDLNATQAGKKYIYKFNLTGGLGYADPKKPGTVNGEDTTYNPENDQDNNSEDKLTDVTDPYSIGTPIVGSAFKFAVEMTGWNGTAEEIETKL